MYMDSVCWVLGSMIELINVYRRYVSVSLCVCIRVIEIDGPFFCE